VRGHVQRDGGPESPYAPWLDRRGHRAAFTFVATVARAAVAGNYAGILLITRRTHTKDAAQLERRLPLAPLGIHRRVTPGCRPSTIGALEAKCQSPQPSASV